MNFLNNMSIKLKLFLIFIIPTIALTYQIISEVIDKKSIANLHSISEIATASEHLNKLTSSLNDELDKFKT